MGKSTTCGIGTALSAVGTMLQPNEMLQNLQMWLTLFGLGLTILVTLSGIFSKIYKKIAEWHKNAVADKKISKDEIKELGEILKSGLNDLNSQVQELKKESDFAKAEEHHDEFKALKPVLEGEKVNEDNRFNQ